MPQLGKDAAGEGKDCAEGVLSVGTDMVVVESSDSVRFEVERDCAIMSSFVKTALEGKSPPPEPPSLPSTADPNLPHSLQPQTSPTQDS